MTESLPVRTIGCIRFTVEQHGGGRWHLVGELEAQTAWQALIRASGAEGIYRVRESGTAAPHIHFRLPRWGPPEEIEDFA